MSKPTGLHCSSRFHGLHVPEWVTLAGALDGAQGRGNQSMANTRSVPSRAPHACHGWDIKATRITSAPPSACHGFRRSAWRRAGSPPAPPDPAAGRVVMRAWTILGETVEARRRHSYVAVSIQLIDLPAGRDQIEQRR